MPALADARPWEGAAGGIRQLPNAEDQLVVVWVGSGCDKVVRMSVSAAFDRVAIALGPIGDCAMAMNYRGIVLDVRPPVAADSIELDIP